MNAGRDPEAIEVQQDARRLAGAARLRARYRFEAGHHRAALDDVFAMLRLARHVGRGGSQLDMLLEIAVEAQAVELAAWHVWALHDDATCRDFLARWDAVPRPRSCGEILRTKRDAMIAQYRHHGLDWPGLKRPDLLGRVEKPAPKDRLSTGAFRAGRESEAQAVEKFVAVVRRSFDGAAAITELPFAEVRAADAAWYEAFEKRAATQRDEPHLKQFEAGCYLMAQPYRLRMTHERAAVTRAMLRAAVAAKLRGDNTPTERDPHGDGPFARTVTPTGYELRTKLNDVVNPNPVIDPGRSTAIMLTVRTAAP